MTPELGLLGRVRAIALMAVWLGAAGSVGFMLYAGRRNSSKLLLVLFAGWVVSPFVVFVVASVFSSRWSAVTRGTLYWTTIVVALGSLAIYGDVALGHPREKTAFLFLVIPPASWLII